MKKLSEHLIASLMDNFHWTDIKHVTMVELALLHTMMLPSKYDLNPLLLIQFWILYSYSQDAQFLIISTGYAIDFERFIDRWIKENNK